MRQRIVTWMKNGLIMTMKKVKFSRSSTVIKIYVQLIASAFGSVNEECEKK